jgi:mono/diheme cytochrome c family protein
MNKVKAHCQICHGTDGFHGLLYEDEGCPRGDYSNTVAAHYVTVSVEWLWKIWDMSDYLPPSGRGLLLD